MKSFKNIEFWQEIFCSENEQISSTLYDVLLADFTYKKETKTSKLDGQHYDYETLTIAMPITAEYQLALDFDVEEKCLHEQQLYLIHKNNTYKLGIRDNFHCDDTVFTITDFYALMALIKSNNAEKYPYYFLLLSRYVTLKNDIDGRRLTHDVVKLFYEIFPQDKESQIEIRNVEPEFLKRKVVGDTNSLISFMIDAFNEINEPYLPSFIHYNKTDLDNEEQSIFLRQVWEDFINSLT